MRASCPALVVLVLVVGCRTSTEVVESPSIGGTYRLVGDPVAASTGTSLMTTEVRLDDRGGFTREETYQTATGLRNVAVSGTYTLDGVSRMRVRRSECGSVVEHDEVMTAVNGEVVVQAALGLSCTPTRVSLRLQRQ